MYISPTFHRFLLEESRLQERQDGFYEHLLELHQKTNDAYCSIMDATKGDPIGIEFQRQSTMQWAFIVPEMSFPEEGLFRIQYFDECGFYSHYTYKTIEEAIEAMAKERFSVHCEGKLVALASTQKWQRGVEINAVLYQLNSKTISWETFNNHVDAINTKYAALI